MKKSSLSKKVLKNGNKIISCYKQLLLVEDDCSQPYKRSTILLLEKGKSNIRVQIHKIINGKWKESKSKTPSLKQQQQIESCKSRQEVAVSLLSNTKERQSDSIIVAGTAYGSSFYFIDSLIKKELEFVVEIRHSHYLDCLENSGFVKRKASDLLKDATWKKVEITTPLAKSPLKYLVTDLAFVLLSDNKKGRLFAAQVGGIEGIHRGTIIGLTSLCDDSLKNLIDCLGWVRWIRPIIRRQERSKQEVSTIYKNISLSKKVNGRAQRRISSITQINIKNESGNDVSCTINVGKGPCGVAFGNKKILNVVELFAGAGGMGLGFLMAKQSGKRYRLVFAGELHPIYTQTIRTNHEYLLRMQRKKWSDFVPESLETVNLNSRKTNEMIVSRVRESGGVDVLIGGPPCQGFSSANRNSGSSSNPNNRLVNVFMRYVEKLQPPVFLMENVPGITWTAKNGKAKYQPSVADHILKRMMSAGYITYPKILDAAWYGVPQYRNRFFVLGIHKDTNYRVDDFGEWGPFPRPTHGPNTGREFVTVRDAIGDLPVIGNGHLMEEMKYCKPVSEKTVDFLRLMQNGSEKGNIMDHITSRHAEYVIERYEQIPPGGNWRDIAEMMSNYTQLDRTHSNIYKRLEWDKPSITIGHYRKSMLIHPDQHRGLSLREACRLQSFPDWFRFEGSLSGKSRGLMHKQQQLANAVCPLMSKALAQYLMKF